MLDDGWDVTQTGGGCLAFERQLGEDDFVLVAADGGLKYGPEDLEWGACRYLIGGHATIEVVEQTDLATVIANYERIPVPSEGQTVYKSWDEVPEHEEASVPGL